MNRSHEEDVQRIFDCFCKKVLRNEARDYYAEIKRKQDHEAALSELQEQSTDGTCAMDAYPSDFWSFSAAGCSFTVKDDAIAEALAALSYEKRAIVLLSYFLDMTDKEIGDKLNLLRRTVQKMRTSALRRLKKLLEEQADGKAIS